MFRYLFFYKKIYIKTIVKIIYTKKKNHFNNYEYNCDQPSFYLHIFFH